MRRPTVSLPRTMSGRYHVLKAGDVGLAPPPGLDERVVGLRRATLVGAHVGALHTGLALCALAPGGTVSTHLHSTEQSFYVLEGNPTVAVDGRPHRLAPGDCGVAAVGAPPPRAHDAAADALWLEVNAPAPRVAGPPDTFWTGDPAPAGPAQPVDVRDPRTRAFFHLAEGEMDVDNLKVGMATDAPRVSASMATALLAYSGIAVKMLVDQRLAAALHTTFMVEYEPGGVALPHDHPLEESYYILEGAVEATADGDRFVLEAGDVFWTGVGCIHSFENSSGGRVRWFETQSPQPPAQHSYRFDRDWEYLQQRLG
jgi:quercetin dioxygenase-like cupin family protein